MNHRTQLAALVFVILAGVGIATVISVFQSSSTTAQPAAPAPRPKRSTGHQSSEGGAEAIAEAVKPTLSALMQRWHTLDPGLQGHDLSAARKELVSSSLSDIRDGGTFLSLLDFLATEGQGDLSDWVKAEGFKNWLTSPDGDRARKWVLTLTDLKLQEALCFATGQTFPGTGFKEFLDSFASIHSQSRLLGGYFSEMAKTDPEGAVNEFMAARPPKVDYTALRHVMGAAPAGSDFIRLSSMIPADSHSLAKEARKALLKAWANSAPETAAQYVIENRKLVRADQLEQVIRIWHARSPQEAEYWTDGLPPGDYREYALEGIVNE